MKKYFLLLLTLFIVLSCDSDDNSNNNRYLPNYNFSIDLNTDLPEFTDLRYTGSPVYVGIAGAGINGVIVMNSGSGYVAYEASCPNQELSSCSLINTNDINGINVICPCDDVEYNLFTGLATTPVEYSLKPYRAQQIGSNIIRVYN